MRRLGERFSKHVLFQIDGSALTSIACYLAIGVDRPAGHIAGDVANINQSFVLAELISIEPELVLIKSRLRVVDLELE